MADAKTIYVLARCAEAGFEEAAIEAISRYDPFQRPGIRRRVRAAIEAARGKVGSPGQGEELEAHLMRVALLEATGKLAGVPADDVPAVKAAVEPVLLANPAARGRAFWPATTLLLGALAAAALLVGGAALRPSEEERFMRSAFGTALGEPLTRFVVAAGRGQGKAKEHRDKLLAARVRKQIGEEGIKSFEEVLDQTIAVETALTPEETKRAMKLLDESASRLDAELAARKIPGFVDTFVFDQLAAGNAGGTVYVLGYYVYDRAVVRYGEHAEHKVLWGRRLDRLNLKAYTMIYESAALGGLMLSIDELEEHLLKDYVGSLGKDPSVQLGLERGDGPGAKRLASLMKAELLRKADLSDVEGEKMAELIVKRKRAFERLQNIWNEPKGLLLYPREEERLASLTDNVDAKEAAHVNAQLRSFRRQFSKLETSVAGTAEEMRLSYLDGSAKQVLFSDHDIARSVAADLGTLARGRGLPVTTLAEIVREVHGGSRAARLGAMAALSALGTDLGLKSAASWLNITDEKIDERSFDEQAFVAFLDELLHRSPADIVAAAGKAYQRLLGSPPPAYERRPG